MITRKFTAVAPWAAALAASLTLASPAAAMVHHLTYKGVVTSALDQTGEFGQGASLVGMSFIAKVVYDDANPGASHTGGVYYDDYAGYGADNPVTASILLNGVTRTFGATYGRDSRLDRTLQPGCLSDCTAVSFQQNAEDRYTQGGIYTLNYINLGGSSDDGALSGLAHTAPNFSNPPFGVYAYVSLFEQDIVTLAVSRSAAVFVTIDSVTGAVPEPSSWALMLLGFGGVGGLMRRRHAATRATA